MNDALQALSALAQKSRLEVFRVLVREGSQGLAAGALAERLALPASTLSFHLNQLTNAGLVRQDRQGRSIRYSLDPRSLNELFWFLGEDCCQGNSALCAEPAGRIELRRNEARTPAPRPRVLFLCSHNSARSQMAEAILRDRAGDRFEVHSCGLRPDEIHPLTLQVLREAELDTSSLRSRDLGEFLGKVSIHHAIVVCEQANEHCPRLHPFALDLQYWPFPDPVAFRGTRTEQLEVFRSVRDAIAERIDVWLSGETPRRA